jgi:hypothetical protein
MSANLQNPILTDELRPASGLRREFGQMALYALTASLQAMM